MSDHPGDGEHHIALDRVTYDPMAWDAIVAGYDEAEAFHTTACLSFLAETQRAARVVAVVRAGGLPVGHFVGAIVRRYGVRILAVRPGSPAAGSRCQDAGHGPGTGHTSRDSGRSAFQPLISPASTAVGTVRAWVPQDMAAPSQCLVGHHVGGRGRRSGA